MEPPDAVRSAPIAMTETSSLFIVPLPCCVTNVPRRWARVLHAKVFMVLIPCLPLLVPRCGSTPPATAMGVPLLLSTHVPLDALAG